jgi:hypothetical protein
MMIGLLGFTLLVAALVKLVLLPNGLLGKRLNKITLVGLLLHLPSEMCEIPVLRENQDLYLFSDNMAFLITTTAQTVKSDYIMEAELSYFLPMSQTVCEDHSITVLGAMSWQRGVMKTHSTNYSSGCDLGYTQKPLLPQRLNPSQLFENLAAERMARSSLYEAALLTMLRI